MNWDQIKGIWKQAKSEIQQKCGELTDDELDGINGQRQELVGKVQERYGIAKEEAEKQIKDIEKSCDC
ncbi:MAG: CsbD family protein [Pirellulaceae bacterium]|nr:CsbD family protein [Pirellulaceae bacterium]